MKSSVGLLIAGVVMLGVAALIIMGARQMLKECRPGFINVRGYCLVGYAP